MTSWGTDLVFAVTDAADWQRVERGEDLHDLGGVLDCRISAGMLTGLIRGSGPEDYACRVHIDVLPAPHLALLLTFLRHLPMGRRNSLMLSTLELGLSARGIDLGPDADLPPTAFCECPDYEEYCKHVIALTLHAADLFDEDPWLWLEARGLMSSTEAAPTVVSSVVEEPEPVVEPTLDDELATYWAAGSGEVPAVAEIARPAHRELDRTELVARLVPEFSVQGRSRAKAIDLAERAADDLEQLYVELIASAATVPAARAPRA